MTRPGRTPLVLLAALRKPKASHERRVAGTRPGLLEMRRAAVGPRQFTKADVTSTVSAGFVSSSYILMNAFASGVSVDRSPCTQCGGIVW